MNHTIKFGTFALFLAVILILPWAEGSAAASSDAPRDWREFVGKNAAITVGTIFDGVVTEYFSPKEVLYFDDYVAPVEAVYIGKADFSVMDELVAEKILKNERYSDLESIPVPRDMFDSPIGAISADQGMIDAYNAFLAQIRADGTLEEMTDRWLYSDNPVMPEIPLTGENGTLIVATDGTTPLWSFRGDNGAPAGFEIEHMTRFAGYLGKDVKFEMMAFAGIIPYVVSGKAHIGAADITITEERKKSVTFTDSYFDSGAVVVVKKSEESLSGSPEKLPGKPKTFEDYMGTKIGVEVGDTFDKTAEKLNAEEIVSYATQADMLAALNAGKVDAILLPDKALPMLKSLADYDLDFLEVPREYYYQDLAPIFHEPELRDKFNDWLALIEANGVLEQMNDFWFNRIGLPEDEDIPHQTLKPVNGTLTVCDTGNYPPLVYISAGEKVNGFDIDMVERFAEYLNMDLNIVTMGYDAVGPYIISGKADMSACLLAITPDREENMLFGDPIQTNFACLIVKSESGEANTGLIAWLKDGVQNNLLKESRWKLIVSGINVTLTISVTALLLGTLLGCLICLLLTRKTKWAKIPVYIYNAIIRGLPVVVLLMVFYYIVFGKSGVSPVIVAIAAFSLVEGAGIGSNLKGAIDTVDTVQIEAARSIGFTAFGAFKRVTLPQAIKVALPGYLNGFVELVKGTAIVGYIAIQDLSRAGDIIRSRTYDAYFPILFVALVYLAITSIMVWVFKLIIRRVAK